MAAAQRGSQQQPIRILHPDSFTQRVLQTFDQRTTYDKEAPVWHQPLAQELVRRAQLVPGQDVLDIATGSGLVAEMAAEAVGSTGSVLGIDISPGMLAQAAPKAKRLPNLTIRQADAQTAEFEPASFDIVLCSNGLVYMLDVGAAVKRWAGWLRPGGKLCFNTPQSPMLKSQTIFLEAAQAQGLWLEDPAAVVGSPENVRRVLAGAGFQDSKILVEGRDEQGYGKDWTPKEYAERLWHVQLRFLPVDSVLGPEALSAMKQQWQEGAEQYAQRLLKEQGCISEVPRMLWVTAEASG